MITMECQPGGHGGHLGHSMMLDPSGGAMHQQEQEHKKKRKSDFIFHSHNSLSSPIANI